MTCVKRLCAIVFLIACGVLGCGPVGCDGMVALEGYVVSGQGPPTLTLTESMPERPASILDQAVVELWTADRKTLLSSWHASDGFFSVGLVGSYEPGMKYLLYARADGHRSYEGQVTLERATGLFGIISLTPHSGGQLGPAASSP